MEHAAPAGVEDAPRPPEGTWHATVRQITTGNVLVGFLAVLLAVIVGSLLILLTDEEVREAAGYITARPSDFFQAASDAITGAYSALFRGSIYNTRATDFETGIRPLTETLKFAGPLIAAGLGIGLGFRAGLFNIGGRGQMLLAGAAAGWVAINVRPPGPLLLDRRRRRGHGGRSPLGRTGRPAQGTHRRPRGDRHDHAQLRRLLPGLLPAHHAGPAAGAGVGQRQVPAPARERPAAQDPRRHLQPAPRLRAGPGVRGPGLVAAEPIRRSATGSGPSARTPTPPVPPASTSAAPTSSRCSSPVAWSRWPASTRCSAP